MGFKVVIPARYASTRLPAKPLLEIVGRPLVVHVWERARACGADEVLIAADEQRIADAVEQAGGTALLTSARHTNGTERIAEVARVRGWSDDTIVINLQGDEPLVPPHLLDELAAALQNEPRAQIATFATPIRDVATLLEPSIVKVVLDEQGYALYFSRAPIPWVRDAFARGAAPTTLPEGVPFLRHLGLYAYRAGTLRRLSRTPASDLERAESLEQLRALGLSIAIRVCILEQAPPPGVDTKEDLDRVRRHIIDAA